MVKKLLLKDKIEAYLSSNGGMTLKHVADKFNTSTAYVSTVRMKMRTAALAKAVPSPKEAVPSPEETVPSPTVDQILDQRDSIYGGFDNVAETSQQLKMFFYSRPQYPKMAPFQREALDMIANKLSRILNGDPNYQDSWTDIAGYATLVSRSLAKKA